MKRCSNCHIVKPVIEFHKSTRSKDGLQAMCKKCKLDRKKTNPKVKLKRREWVWRSRGITPELISLALKQQQGKCAICLQKKPLVPDHCHKKLKFRGMLCQGCNMGLGVFKDDISILRRAINYVRNEGI